MNSVNLIGRLTKDPEMRNSANGKSYCNFTIAISDFFGGKEYTNFIPCIAWEKTAENLAKYMKKGSQIGVEGSINVRQENKDGNFNTIIVIRVNRLEFLGSSTNTENNSFNSNSSRQSNQSSNNDQVNTFDITDQNSFEADDSILWDD